VANPRRIKRLEQVILQTAAQHVQRELDDPRIGLVSITRVKLSSDLSRCRLFWSCIGSDAERRTTERGLEDALASVQRAVAGSMQTRVTPRLALTYDTTLAEAEHLETIFTKLRAERGEDPAQQAPEGEDEAADDDAVEDDAVEDDAPEDDAPEDPPASS